MNGNPILGMIIFTSAIVYFVAANEITGLGPDYSNPNVWVSTGISIVGITELLLGPITALYNKYIKKGE